MLLLRILKLTDNLSRWNVKLYFLSSIISGTDQGHNAGTRSQGRHWTAIIPGAEIARLVQFKYVLVEGFRMESESLLLNEGRGKGWELNHLSYNKSFPWMTCFLFSYPLVRLTANEYNNKFLFFVPLSAVSSTSQITSPSLVGLCSIWMAFVCLVALSIPTLPINTPTWIRCWSRIHQLAVQQPKIWGSIGNYFVSPCILIEIASARSENIWHYSRK